MVPGFVRNGVHGLGHYTLDSAERIDSSSQFKLFSTEYDDDAVIYLQVLGGDSDVFDALRSNV